MELERIYEVEMPIITHNHIVRHVDAAGGPFTFSEAEQRSDRIVRACKLGALAHKLRAFSRRAYPLLGCTVRIVNRAVRRGGLCTEVHAAEMVIAEPGYFCAACGGSGAHIGGRGVESESGLACSTCDGFGVRLARDTEREPREHGECEQ